MKNKNITNFIEIDINKCVKADWNYKQNEQEKQGKLTNQIKKNGQLENCIVREIENGQYEVVNGNHRVDSFMELGLETILVYNLGSISLQTAKRIAIETNETRFNTDQIKLSEIIKNLTEDYDFPDLVDTLPYSETELKDLAKLCDFNWEQYESHIPDESDGGSDNKMSFVFVFEKQEYNQLKTQFDTLKNEFDVKTYEDVLTKLLGQYD